MSQAAAASITPLQPWEAPGDDAPARCPCYYSKIRLLCRYTNRNAYTSPAVGALLSTGDPLSIVLPWKREGLMVHVEPVGHRYPLEWYGVPCALVRVRIGLPVLGSAIPRPFKLLALLPMREVEDVPPFIRLGAEFLHANRATVHLSSSPCEGRLIIPYL